MHCSGPWFSTVCCHINISTVWSWFITEFDFQQLWINLSSGDAYVALLRLVAFIIAIQFQNKKCDMFQQPLQLSCTGTPISIKDPYWFISLAVFFHLLLWSLWEGAHATASTDWLWECRRGRQTVFIRDDLLPPPHTHTLLLLLSATAWSLPHLLSPEGAAADIWWHHFRFSVKEHPVSVLSSWGWQPS